jgi:hypothetical protein
MRISSWPSFERNNFVPNSSLTGGAIPHAQKPAFGISEKADPRITAIT